MQKKKKFKLVTNIKVYENGHRDGIRVNHEF